jgi:hypothetical protein
MNFFTRQEWCLALLLAVVTAVGCSSASKSDKRLDGTWVGVEDGIETELRLKRGSYEVFLDGGSAEKGTYATDNGTITMVKTQLFGSTYNDVFAKMRVRGVALESKWYSVAEFAAELKPMLLKSGLKEKQVDGMITELVTVSTDTYTVDDKNLVMASKSERVTTYTKK